MATTEETRFAMGIFAVIIVVSLGALALKFTGGSESAREKPAQASRQKSEQARTSKATEINRASRPNESSSQRVDPQPVERVAGSATASIASAMPPVSTATQSESVVPVIDPVPLGIFDSPLDSSQLPSVVAKYRDRVSRGALFMARLEGIVSDTATTSRRDQRKLSMEFTARSQTKQINYQSKDVAQWIEAKFSSPVSQLTRDVLVDVRRATDSASVGERVALFFASIHKYDNKPGFAMAANVGDEDAVVLVYALTDELPMLGKARLTRSDILEP